MANAEVTPGEAGRRGESAIELLEKALKDAYTLEKRTDEMTPELLLFASRRFQDLLEGALKLLRNAEDYGK